MDTRALAELGVLTTILNRFMQTVDDEKFMCNREAFLVLKSRAEISSALVKKLIEEPQPRTLEERLDSIEEWIRKQPQYSWSR